MPPAERKNARYDGFRKRIRFLAVCALAAFSLLGFKLWRMQIIRGEHYAHQAERLRLHFQWLQAPRGMILDRHGRVLADTQPARDLVILPALCEEREQEVAALLHQLINVDEERLLNGIKHAREENEHYRHVLVKRNVSMTELARVLELASALPGVFPDIRPQRRYLHGAVGGQLMGYLREVDDRDLSAQDDEGPYKMGDLIGRGGLELQYEELLRGRDGQLWVTRYADGMPQLEYRGLGQGYAMVDVYGRRLREEQDLRVQPEPGQTLRLTLDIDLQRYAENLLQRKMVQMYEEEMTEEVQAEVDRAAMGGAIAVLEADTGAVLALASTPRYDPTVFITGEREEVRRVLYGESDPMLNRCYREHYPPGSVFKVLLAMAALEEDVLDEETCFSCDGLFYLPGVSRPWRCWRLKYGGHGKVGVVDALAFSCDEYFYNVGLLLEAERIDAWSERFGLGVRTGIDIPGEVPGLVPSPEHKRAKMKNILPDQPSEWAWYPGDTVNLSIGQGDALTTPLQNAVLMSAVINGGRRVRPFLNRDLGPDVSEPLVSAHTLELVRQGMRKCIEKKEPPSGTGWRAAVPGMVVLGKTGTAQAVARNVYSEYGEEENRIPFAFRDHAWFVAGVLDREPRIALCVLIEHGLHGSSGASPLARDVIEYFYSKNPQPTYIARKEGGA